MYAKVRELEVTKGEGEAEPQEPEEQLEIVRVVKTPVKETRKLKNLFKMTKECLSENVTLNPLMMTPSLPPKSKLSDGEPLM